MSPVIGNLADATAAINGGGTYIGGGCARSAYLINGVVYKIQVINDRHWTPNETEYSNYLTRKELLPEGVHFPLTEIFYVNDDIPVIAMQFIEGEPLAECNCAMFNIEVCREDCLSPVIQEIVSKVIVDTSGHNTIVNEDGIWIIDIEG